MKINIFNYILLTNFYLFPKLIEVDFDISLGKNNPYFSEFYINCLATSNDPKTSWAATATRPLPITNLMNLCRHIYKKNISVPPSKNGNRIPNIIHQIWLGSPFPKKYEKWQKSWQNIPGWEYKIWTDADVKKIKLFNQDLYDKSKNFGERADILRIEILYQFGGLYVDTDFECLKPEMFTELNRKYDFYAGLHPLDSKSFSLVNALIGSVPKHPILLAYIKNVKYQTDTDIAIKTGPGLFTRAFTWGVNRNQNIDMVFPPTYFYPMGSRQLEKLGNVCNDFVKNKVVTAESIAIHWWEGSWETDIAKVK